MVAALGFAQRFTDKIDRGLVAVPSGSGNLVSWRVLGEEYYDVTYNLYCNGTKIAENLEVSNFLHTSGTASSKYYVIPVGKGKEKTNQKSKEVTRWANGYFDIPVGKVVDRNGNDVTSEYIINDISLGDVDGDSVVEFMVKRNYTGDIRNSSNTTKFHHYECYKLNGKRLWWIDLGPNMMAGPDEQWDLVSYDWDMDGKAECLMRGADNMIIHSIDDNGNETIVKIGNMNYVAPRDEYTHFGAEYLLYMDGKTCIPYGCSATANATTAFTPMDYPLPRFETGESDYAVVWGQNDTGHRSSKHYFGAPYLDGRKPSIFLGRGCYTQHKMCALDVDPATHQLSIRKPWPWRNNQGWTSPWYGNGFHNFAIGDVDWDGRDEIIFGSMIIDDNGKGLCTTGNGHGDAQHCSDFDPYRHGGEQFTCNEDEPACTYYNATTGQIYYRLKSTSDDGRALAGNFYNDYPGSVGRTTQTSIISLVKDKESPLHVPNPDPNGGETNYGMYWGHLNQRIYWDSDLLDEVFDSPGSNARAGAIYKGGNGRIFNATGSQTNNDSKNNPCAIADIFGDWREELVMRADNNIKIRIYATSYATDYRIPTLWHDHQYRNAIVTQPIGYNQPPHKSYFLGEMEGITVAPPAYTMTDRTEVPNGGTISSSDNGKHLIVCETNDTKVTIENNASPSIMTFNVPSWVQGNAGSNISTTPAPTYTYFTCEVSGGALSGDTRLVKQGDGILTLPKADFTNTGETHIWAGTLNFDGTLKQSPLWLNRFAELNSDGGEFKSIKADYASIIRPGGADKASSITVDETYTMGFGSRLILDLYSENLQADRINTKTLKIEKKTGTAWEQYGPKYLRPVIEVVEHFADGATTLAEGKYIIGNVTEIEGSLADIKVEGITDLKYGLSIDEQNNLILSVGSMRDASEIVWTGSTNANWDFAKTENFFLLDDAEQTPNIFVKGDIINFNNDGIRTSVTLVDELSPDSVKVSGTKSYTFQGTGAIVAGALVKEGTGKLTIKNDNSYKGGNYLKGGTVLVSSLSNENRATGNLGAVTTAANKFTMENGAIIQTTAGVTNGSPIKMVGEQGGVILANANMDFIQNKAFSGTLLTKKGTGWLKTYASNTALNKLSIVAGRVVNNSGVPAKAVEFQGSSSQPGELEDASTSALTVPLEVPANKYGKFILGAAYYQAYNNKVTGSGTLTIVPTNTVSRVCIEGDWSAFEGTIKHTTTGIWLPLRNALGIPKGTLDIADGCTVTNVGPYTKNKASSGQTFTIGKLTGKGSLAHPVANFSGSEGVNGTNTWKVGNSWEKGDFTFGGIIHDDGGTNKSNFEKIGDCKMTVSGVWDNTGTTKVTEGELAFQSTSALGKGALTVAVGARLSGVTKAGGSLTNSSYTINGELQPGSTATASTTASIINFGGKNVTFGSSSKLVLGLRKTINSKGEVTLQNASITNIAKLTFNAGATIAPFIEETYRANLTTDENTPDEFTLWTSVTTPSLPTDLSKLNFALPALNSWNYWDTSRIGEGVLLIRYSKSLFVENLKKLIASAEEYGETIKGDYPNAAAKLNDAIQPAKATAQKSNPTQSELEEAEEIVINALAQALVDIEIATGIDDINSSADDDDAIWYDLNGRMLSGKPTTPGIYVKNGKKVLVKQTNNVF